MPSQEELDRLILLNAKIAEADPDTVGEEVNEAEKPRAGLYERIPQGSGVQVQASPASALPGSGTSGISPEAYARDMADKSTRAAMADRINSTSDRRTVNNVMRHEYKVLNDTEKAQMQSIKDAGLTFHQMLGSMGESRELSLAKTKIEEAVMWAVKHVTK